MRCTAALQKCMYHDIIGSFHKVRRAPEGGDIRKCDRGGVRTREHDVTLSVGLHIKH